MSVRPPSPTIAERIRKRRRGAVDDGQDHSADAAEGTANSAGTPSTPPPRSFPTSPETPWLSTPSVTSDDSGLLTPLTPMSPSPVNFGTKYGMDVLTASLVLSPSPSVNSPLSASVPDTTNGAVPVTLGVSTEIPASEAGILAQDMARVPPPVADIPGPCATVPATAGAPDPPATPVCTAPPPQDNPVATVNVAPLASHVPQPPSPVVHNGHPVATEVAVTPAGAAVPAQTVFPVAGAVTTTAAVGAPVTPTPGTPAALLPAAPILQAVIAAPQLLPGFEDVPAAVLAMVQNVATTSIPALHTYSAARAPYRLDWGRGRLERRLTEGTATTFIRYAGRVRTSWFFGRGGEPQSRVNIGVTLLYDTDESALDKLYHKAKPSSGVPEVVFASRLQGQRQRGSFNETVVPFANVFNARDGVLARTDDRRINAVDFADNDIVAIDAELTRWRKPRASGWTEFDVGFELNAIYLLWDAPAA